MSKLLIISNAALCQSDSNGRTISRLLDCIPKEEKYQFYVYGNPDFEKAKSFYHVSDRDVFESFINRRRKNGVVSEDSGETDNKSSQKNKKTPLKMLLRELVWKCGTWRNKHLKRWLNKMQPKAIFLMAGDNCFTINFARWVAKKQKIPIILYSSEEYPFKNYNYVTKKHSLCYIIWHKKMKNAYNKAAKFIKAGIFNTEALMLEYSQTYNYPCYVIYSSSDIDWQENSKQGDSFKIAYLGNLGLKRHRALIEIAETIGEINPNLKIDVYGNATDGIKADLEKCKFISYNGFVSYDVVLNIIHNSTLLIHAEYNDDFYVRDLKYAFSTKITDSICSGTPFLIYASDELAETKFLRENDCAFVASNKDELKEQLLLALTDEEARRRKLANAHIVKVKYFTNKGQFAHILETVISENTSSK